MCNIRKLVQEVLKEEFGTQNAPFRYGRPGTIDVGRPVGTLFRPGRKFSGPQHGRMTRKLGDKTMRFSRFIEDERAAQFADASRTFRDGMKQLQRDLRYAPNVEKIGNILDSLGFDPYDIVQDSTAYEKASMNSDASAMRDILLRDLEPWARTKIQQSNDNDLDSEKLRAIAYKGLKDPLKNI